MAPPVSPRRASPRDAYTAALSLLARRELSEAQIRTRLRRREFEDGEIDEAVRRLRDERSLDDSRVALAYARTEANLRQRGRDRILRGLQTMGIAPSTARSAVDMIFGELDESALLEQALQRRLRHGADLTDRKTLHRLHRYLIAQGHDAGRVSSLLRRRTRGLDDE